MANKLSALAREIQQTKPFPSTSVEAALGLLRTTDVVRRYLGAVIEPLGITQTQYNVLRILRGAGERGLPTLEIADRLIEQTPGITRMIDRLIAKGLVARERCAEDRRVIYCRITPDGGRILDELAGPVAAADRAALSMLSEEEQRTLIALLDAIRAGRAKGAGVES